LASVPAEHRATQAAVATATGKHDDADEPHVAAIDTALADFGGVSLDLALLYL
jgi:hypothetical protein